MDTSQALAGFDRLVQQADALEGDENELNQLAHEPVFEAALELVLAHLELREAFARKFVDMLDKNDWELFEYCMHELRWLEVQAHVEDRVRIAADPRQRRDLSDERRWRGVLSAFSDGWSGGDGYYKRFGG
jgi:hypothetical protein